MTTRKIIFFLTAINLFIAFTAEAQYKFEKAVHITRESGLPVNENRHMAKGEDGFIWIATDEGLCRFDGLQVRIFSEGKDLSHSLMDNNVSAVLPLKDRVWVGNKQGVSILNTNNYTFRHYQLTTKGKTDSIRKRFDQNISVLFRDRSGKIWIGTSDRGAAVYDESKDDFRFFSLPAGKYPPLVPALGSQNTVLSINESNTNDSIIWVGTTAGLQEINKYSGKVELFTFPQASKDYQVALNAFRRLYHHDDGLLYVGSWAASVNIFDPVAKTFTPIEVKSETGKKLLKSVIGNLTRKSDHEIWVSTLIGLAVYDTRLKDITWHKFNDPENLELYSIGFIDEANRVWYADVNGLSYFDPAVQQFSTYSFKPLSKPDWAFAFYIIPDKTGDKITVCPRVTDGILVFDKTNKSWTKKDFPGNEIFLQERNSVKGCVQFSPGEYVISSDKGIYRYSANKNTIKKVDAGLPFSPTRRGDLLADRSGNIWITDNTWGLTKWNPQTNKVVNYKDETISADTVGPANRLLNKELWAERGFEVASNQLRIANNFQPQAKQNFTAPINLREDDSNIELKGKNFTITFNKANGGLNSYVQNGKEQVKNPLLPHFTRAQTDNDKRGWKTHRVLKQWYESKPTLVNISTGKFDGHLGSGILVQSIYSFIHDSAKVTVSYEVYGNGFIQVNYELDTKQGLPNIPRVGMQMGIERNYDNIEWFGRGPFENYIDKRYGADVGIYNFPIKDFIENYVIPQENGNRTDVRWIYLSDPKTKDGLLVVADSLLSMSAWPYTEENIQNAKHTNKLKDAGLVTLNIDLIQMGVGGNDSWSDVAAPLQQYQIKAQPYHYSFYIVPFNSKTKEPGLRVSEIK